MSDTYPDVYHWRVTYEDGAVLDEQETCTAHEAGRIDPASCHVFACIDRARAQRIEIVELPGVALEVGGVDVEPIFFRRRVLRPVPDDGGGVRGQRVPELETTWIGRRVLEDGVTVSERFIVVFADGTSREQADSVLDYSTMIGQA